MDKTPEELYRERLKRVEDTIQLKVPDRIPFVPHMGIFAARYAGLSPTEAFYDSEKWLSACKKAIVELEPDMYRATTYPGRALEAVECKQMKWPGHGGPTNSTYQYVEKEYMKAEEYDAFFNDPSDFLVRAYLPRIFGTLEPLQKLPPLPSLFINGFRGATTSVVFAETEMAAAFASLYKAGMETRKYRAEMAVLDRDLRSLGFLNSTTGPNMHAPFDVVASMLRGIRGVMLDMYRQPDNLLAMMDRILHIELGEVARMKKDGFSPIHITLHFGADGFMSPKQFETFYWPGLKKLILALIDQGITPCPFLEGDFTSRLHYFTELPKGKVLLYIAATDPVKAKEILGNTACIAGNVPVSLLQSGTPVQVKEYSKKIIDVAGKGGGFIMSSRSVLDDADPELVKVWAKFTREYGCYK